MHKGCKGAEPSEGRCELEIVWRGTRHTRVVLSLWFCLCPGFGAPTARTASCLPYVWTNNTLPWRGSVFGGVGDVFHRQNNPSMAHMRWMPLVTYRKDSGNFPCWCSCLPLLAGLKKQNWRSSYLSCIFSSRQLLLSMPSATACGSHWPLRIYPLSRPQ